MIVVTGATGNIGSRLVRELAARGQAVRAFVRDAAKAEAVLGGDVEVAVGDFADPASIRAAVAGADTVVVSSANDPRQAEYEANVFDAVVATGGHRVVKISSVGAHARSRASFVDWHHRSEQHLARSNLAGTVLRCNFYMSNLFAYADTIREAGQVVAPAGGATVAMVDPRDVAAAAAVVVTEGGHDAATYLLTGPEALTFAQVAASLSAALGRPIEFVDVPGQAAREGALASGLPEWLADGLVSLFGVLEDGIAAATTDTVRALTGRDPRSLREFVQDHAGVFGGSGGSVEAARRRE
ncbi:MAG TPA: SDR family oxidoreductase [Acidimicrobiales bacterium]|nr:SDR family oxidoreductase [Acidimicrobiales bacterium]